MTNSEVLLDWQIKSFKVNGGRQYLIMSNNNIANNNKIILKSMIVFDRRKYKLIYCIQVRISNKISNCKQMYLRKLWKQL